MKRILVAVDGSEVAGRALDMAISIAKQFGASILAINAYAPVFVPPEPFAITDGGVDASLHRYSEECARAAADTASRQGVSADWLSAVGSPSETIADAAVSRCVDLVVVGSRGRGAVTRTLLGSISSRLSHICTLPLLIVH